MKPMSALWKWYIRAYEFIVAEITYIQWKVPEKRCSEVANNDIS
jgi:hypothetical protein